MKTTKKQTRPKTVTPNEFQKLLSALNDVTEYATENCCLHEYTHRGGCIWEICDECGAKWADDEGGMPPDARKYPKEISTALKLLKAYKREGDKT